MAADHRIHYEPTSGRSTMKPIRRHRTVLFCLIAAGIVCCHPRNLDAGRRNPVPVIFDTDIMGDVDDVGAVAVLHALADAGEARILAMGVSAKHPDCAPCLDALNTWFGRPDVLIGVVKGKGFRRDSKYNTQIAREFPHDLRSAAQAPDAATLYRRILARQPDHSVVMISVGQLTNFRNLLHTTADRFSKLDGTALVKRKVKAWVCMGCRFPSGKEANLVHDGPAASDAIAYWPTPIVFSGFEIGKKILTGAGLTKLPANSPVRRAYKLYNGLTNRNSWDQTAVLYAVRGLTGGLRNLWDIRTGGICRVDPNGANRWQPSPDGQHSYLIEKAPPAQIARLIESLMLHSPRRKTSRKDVTSTISRPNILLIMTDDQGFGDLRRNGNSKIDTPILDRLAATSTRFERFFVCPLCTPTRATLLSGRYYLRTGAISVTRGLETMRSSEITIAEVLKTAGYATGCFGKWHLGEHYPNHPNGQGFDEFFGMPTGHWDNYFDPQLDHNGRMVPTKGYITDVLTDAAIRFIKTNRRRPFFCYVPYNAPHTPLQVPDRFFNKYKARGLNDRTAALYGMIENIDGNVNRLLKTLDDLKLTSNTVVFFLSDNGAEGPQGSRYNAGMRGMKGSVHEGGVRVPLFVRWPGHIKSGRTIKQIAAHIDLLPTIAEFAGATIPPTQHLDGQSLVSLLTGRTDSTPTDRMIFTRTPGWKRLVGYKGPAVKNLLPFPAAVRTQRWRMVNEGSGWQLYDMLADPGETKNVSASHPQLVRRLGRAYREWFADVTRVPIERPPISVGYPERPSVELPAPEAYFTGTIRWFNKWGFAHDWLTGWSNVKDSIWWDIDVVQGGRYEVTLMYTCPPESVGTTLRVETAGSSVTGRIPKAHNPQPQQRPSRQTKRRFIQTFASMKLGTIHLRKGRGRITIQAISKPGDRVCDLQSIRLRRTE